MKKSVSVELRSIKDFAHERFGTGVGGHLAETIHSPAREHIRDKEIHMTVPIDISESDAHRAGARVANGRGAERLEFAPAVVDPNAVGGPVIVANVKIWKSIVIEIVESGCEAPIERGMGQWLACFIAE